MDDLKQQLRRHYEGQQLPAGRVQEILAAGRAAATARAARRWRQLAAAAAVILGLGIFGAQGYFGQPAEPPRIAVASIAEAVAGYFSKPDYHLSLISADRPVLAEWLRQHGGPAEFEVPPAMAGLSSYGCQVLEVRGQKVFLICFLLDAPPAGTPAGAMPEKKMMVTVGPDGRMLKKTRPLVHLVVAPRNKFAEVPRPGERIVLPAAGEWNFATWTKGDQLFVAAGALPADRLAALVRAL